MQMSPFKQQEKQITEFVEGFKSDLNFKELKSLAKRVLQIKRKLKSGELARKYSFAFGLALLILGTNPGNQANAQSFDFPKINPFGMGPITTYGIPSLVDIDGDSDLDIVYSSLDGKPTLIFLQNIGTSTIPSFAAPVINAFSFTPSLGNNYLMPLSFADLDNDGDLDMMAGSYYSTAGPYTSFYGDLLYYENTGTKSAAKFDVMTRNPFGLKSVYQNSFPEFADIDGDGDQDLLVSEYYGDIIGFENTGTKSNPQFAAGQRNPFNIINPANSGDFRLLRVKDIDGDGDMDLMIGEVGPSISFTENIGSAMSPNFAPPIGTVFNLSPISGYVAIGDYADMDNDGDLDALFLEDGPGYPTVPQFRYFENILNTAPEIGAFNAPDTICSNVRGVNVQVSGINAGRADMQALVLSATSNNPAVMPNPAVTYTSPNTTGIVQLNPVPGQSGLVTITLIVDDGGSVKNTDTIVQNVFVDLCVGLAELEKENVKIYPIPASDYLNLELSNISKEKIELVIYDALGKPVFTKSLSSIEANTTNRINIANLESGLYLLEISTSSQRKFKKFLIN